MQDLEKRVNELEIKFSYQDEIINELNLIIADQQKKVDDLKIIVKNLRDGALNNDSQNSSLKNERPPHY